MREHPLLCSAAALVVGRGRRRAARAAVRAPAGRARRSRALAALPFRVPIEAGGETANLLVPLYLVIAAGALAWAVPRAARRRGVRPAARATARWSGCSPARRALRAADDLLDVDVEKALEQTVFFYVPFALLFAVLRDVEWSPRRLRVGCSSCSGWRWSFVAVGFVEYATRTLLFNPKVIASNQLESYFRVNSLFFDPNIYGRFLALVMLGLAARAAVGAAAAHGLAGRRRRWSCCGAAWC